MDLPAPEARTELVRRYARLLTHFGAEIGERPLVLPTSDFFPDPFRGDEASLERLLRRLALHAGMSDIPLRARLVDTGAAGGCGTGGCGTGSCQTGASDEEMPPRVVEQEGAWVLSVLDAELAQGGLLTTHLVRSLAAVFLAETSDARARIEAPLAVSVDLAAVALGFGALMLEGSYVYKKSCGGPSVTQLTALSTGELAIAFALFVERGAHPTRAALRELGTTQRALASQAFAWARANREPLALLRTAPAALLEAPLALRSPRPWLARLLEGRAKPSEDLDLETALAATELDGALTRLPEATPRKPARPADPRRDELRLLVDEALRAR